MSKSEALFVEGRTEEMGRILACLKSGRNVLLEGAVGVGKTHLVLAVASQLSRPVYRIDGDSRYSEQKLTGSFDPPTVMQKGFVPEAFVAGPLVEAMRTGGVLFINELNRLPEGVQNILLPAIDEGLIQVPRLGEIRAKPGFLVVATQNPKEFVATSHLSEAILDRFEWLHVDYQTESEEQAIVGHRLEALGVAGGKRGEKLISAATVHLVRATRAHPRIRRGASIRAAIAIADLCVVFLEDGVAFEDAFLRAVMMALPTRIEMERDGDTDRSAQDERAEILKELAEAAVRFAADGGGQGSKKKT